MSGQLPRCPLNFDIALTLHQYKSEKLFHTLPFLYSRGLSYFGRSPVLHRDQMASHKTGTNPLE